MRDSFFRSRDRSTQRRRRSDDRRNSTACASSRPASSRPDSRSLCCAGSRRRRRHSGFFALVMQKFRHHRDLRRLVARAHRGRHDQHKISRPDATVSPAKSHKCLDFIRRKIFRRRVVISSGRSRTTGTSLVIFSCVIHSPFSIPRACSDRLSVLTDKFAGRNFARRKTMAGRHGLADGTSSPVGQQSQDPAAVSFLTTATLSFGLTIIA